MRSTEKPRFSIDRVVVLLLLVIAAGACLIGPFVLIKGWRGRQELQRMRDDTERLKSGGVPSPAPLPEGGD